MVTLARWAGALLVAALLQACAPTYELPPTISLDQLVERHEELAGEEVFVRAWLSPCNRFDCYLTDSRENAEIMAAFDPANSSTHPSDWSSVPMVFIGDQSDFGRIGRRLTRDHACGPGKDLCVSANTFPGFMDVILKARVTDRCWEGMGCLHGGNQIEASKIVHVFEIVPVHDPIVGKN